MSELTIPADALRPTLDDIATLSFQLADQIQQDGGIFDALVVLQRGGAIPGALVAYKLGLTATQVISASLTAYEGGTTERTITFSEGQMPDSADVRDKRLLMVDEVCDTGHTLQHMHELLVGLGAASVHTGVLHYKPGRTKTGFVPDYYAEKTDKWIVYPWELPELARAAG